MTNMLLLAQTEDWLANWITPLWLLGLGALVGLVVLAIIWILGLVLCRIPGLSQRLDDESVRGRVFLGITIVSFVGWLIAAAVALAFNDLSGAVESTLPFAVGVWLAALTIAALMSRRVVDDIPLTVREGPLALIVLTAGLLAMFGIFGAAAVNQPSEFLDSLVRLPSVGTTELPPVDVEAGEGIERPIAVTFRRDEIKELRVSSSENVRIATTPSDELPAGVAFDVAAEEPFLWVAAEQPYNPFVDETVSQLYVQNRSPDQATINLTIVTASQHPEVTIIPFGAMSLVLVVLIYLIQRTYAPKLSAVALATIKSELGQPLFPILLALGFSFLILSMFIPYNTFGEDIKMLKDAGLNTIMALAIILAVWTASTTVTEELEGRTALTVLSKPIDRRSFLVGKFVGISWTSALMFIILGAFFLVLVAYKPIYDAKESSQPGTTWELCYLEMIRTIPGLILGFLETVVMAAISVAIATRLTMLANFVICFAIYTLGHMTPLIVQSSAGRFEVVSFVGQLIAVVFPNLEHFNIQAAVAAGVGVPIVYLGWALVYCVVYCTVAMLLGLLLFEDRDLA